MSYVCYVVISNYIMYVMKMENIVPRVGFEETSILCLEWESNTHLVHSEPVCQPPHYLGSLMSPPYPCPPIHAAPSLKGQCKLLHIWPSWHDLRCCQDIKRQLPTILYINMWHIHWVCYLATSIIHDTGTVTET